MQLTKRLLPLLVLIVFVAAACASSGGDQTTVSSGDANFNGFFNGFIHGFVILFALISLIIDSGSDTLLAEPVGDAQWYYGGYLIGILVFFMLFPIGARIRSRR